MEIKSDAPITPINPTKPKYHRTRDLKPGEQPELGPPQRAYSVALSSRQDLPTDQKSDPFYSLRGVGLTLAEDEARYVLTAKIPPHEQEQTRVNVDQHKAVVTIHRRNQAASNTDYGLKTQTQSYETIREEFHLPMKVEANRAVVNFNGDQLTVVVPKVQTPPEYTAPPST